MLRLNAALTHKQGYLTDPYKRVEFVGFEGRFRENRPSTRTDVLLFGEISHYMESWDAALDFNARYGHSSHGMDSVTLYAGLAKEFLDCRLTLKPSVRYYRQSEADYYDTTFRGDPTHFSSDYRVSALDTWTLGLQAHWKLVPDRLSLNLGYERYMTAGTDGKTDQRFYPDAHVLTAGVKVTW